jgi:hypothetical protein
MVSEVLRHIETCNVPAVMAEHDEYMKHSKFDGRDSEEIYRRQILCMIAEESSPGL